MRRLAVLIRKIDYGRVKHDNYVSLIWTFLTLGNPDLAAKLHHEGNAKKNAAYPQSRFRPYVFGVEAWPDEAGFTITFSSVQPEITATVMAGCRAALQKKEALAIETHLFEVQKAIPIQDLIYIGKNMTLKACSPVVASIRKNQTKTYLLYHENPEFWANRIARNLASRTHAYLGVAPREIKVVVMDAGKHIATVYKDTKIPGRYVTVKIYGEPEALQMALYGGIGERTGSGFGMVMPV